jgi:hypothetical protein
MTAPLGIAGIKLSLVEGHPGALDLPWADGLYLDDFDLRAQEDAAPDTVMVLCLRQPGSTARYERDMPVPHSVIQAQTYGHRQTWHPRWKTGDSDAREGYSHAGHRQLSAS